MPRSTFWLSCVIWLVAIGNQGSAPMKWVLKWLCCSTPLVSHSNWRNCLTSGSGSEPKLSDQMKSCLHSLFPPNIWSQRKQVHHFSPEKIKNDKYIHVPLFHQSFKSAPEELFFSLPVWRANTENPIRNYHNMKSILKHLLLKVDGNSTKTNLRIYWSSQLLLTKRNQKSLETYKIMCEKQISCILWQSFTQYTPWHRKEMLISVSGLSCLMKLAVKAAI